MAGTPIRRAQVVEAGLFSSESLFVSFDFTRDALFTADACYREEIARSYVAEMPSEIKTYVHELTHYIHYTTTPYGLFLQYCRVLQGHAVIALVRALLDAGIGFRMPLINHLPEFTGQVAAAAQPAIEGWLNIENLAATLHGDNHRRSQLLAVAAADKARIAAGQRPLFPPLHGLQETFFLVQTSMANMLEQNNGNAMMAGNPIPMEMPISDMESLRREVTAPPAGYDAAIFQKHDAPDSPDSLVSVEALIESAATIAEFWKSPMDYPSFVAWANADIDPELKVYRSCIADALKVIPTQKLSAFVMTYMTLCELALYAPLLPHHATLRMKYPDLRQLLPVERWAELLRVAKDIAPVDGISDYGRYVTDVCRTLNWAHPIQIIASATNGPGQVSNPLAMIYLRAQQYRATETGAFLGINRFLFEPSADAADWRFFFNFMILDYTDLTTYHPNKDLLQSMTTRQLNKLGMSSIMLRKDLRIAAPYRGGGNENQWMTEWLRQKFKVSFGREFPTLQVI
jgi:hypothetical protein